MKKHYVAILPDGSEHFGDYEESSRKNHDEFEQQRICCAAVYNAGIRAKRKDPKSLEIQLFRLDIEKGQIKRVNAGKIKVQLSFEPMTEEEYNEEMNKILSTIPSEFHSFVSSQAYERGHSAGYEEVVGIAENLTNALLPCIREYKRHV